MTMKKLLVLVGAVLLGWTLLAIALIPAKSDSGEVELVWACDTNPQRVPQVEWFNRLYPDVHLNMDADNSGVMKVVVQCSAGMGPDLIDHVHRKTIQTYRDAGILWDVTEQAREMGFGLDTLPEAVRPLVQLRDPETLEYRQYCYPCNYTTTCIYYNKDLFDQYGMDYPSKDLTWEEYIDIGQKLTIREEGETVPTLFAGAGMPLMIGVWCKGGRLINKEGTRCLLGEPRAIAGMQFRHDLYYKYHVEPTPTQKASMTGQGGFGSGQYYSWFGEQKLAMFFGERWMLIRLRQYFSEQRQAKEEWEAEHPNEPYTGVTPFRMGAVHVPRFKGEKRLTWVRQRGAGINKLSPRREEALKFLQYLAGEKYSELINQGADAKPGNKKYVTMERLRHPDWPGEEEINRLAIESIPYGQTARKSMFINHAKVLRILEQTDEVLKAKPGLTPDRIAALMKNAARRIDEQIAHNISRSPRLRKAYHKLLDQGAEPIANPKDIAIQ